MIKGLAVLSLSFLLGMWCGQILGVWLAINTNVGGVGFAMIFLLLSKEFLDRKGWWSGELEFGIEFWNKLYIPIVIAMAASLNVKSAISSGWLAILAGILPVLVTFWAFKTLAAKFNTSQK